MRAESCLSAVLSSDLAEPLTCTQKETLERAVTKIVALGEEMGVSAEQMVELLQGGPDGRPVAAVLDGTVRRNLLNKNCATPLGSVAV
jgi:hypothetical protein